MLGAISEGLDLELVDRVRTGSAPEHVVAEWRGVVLVEHDEALVAYLHTLPQERNKDVVAFVFAHVERGRAHPCAVVLREAQSAECCSSCAETMT